MKNAARFRSFLQDMTRLVTQAGDDEALILDEGSRLLAGLISRDDWLPERFAEPHPDHYQQYLLYCDPLERFSVVSFVWRPGEATPVHDHTVWGMAGVMRGEEICREFVPNPEGCGWRVQAEHHLKPGEVDLVSPRIGDVHQVLNALPDRASLSIHVYGANIGAVPRHTFDPETGAVKPFVSGYCSDVIPNFWDRAAEVRAKIGA